ncbi:MAG TPA: hypothetical protein VGG57_14160 [Stellaceae bacterium]|jgi:hypothetical protein
MLRTLVLLAMLGVAACGHDEKPPSAPAHDPDDPIAAPITPVQQEPLKPQ